MGRLSRVAVYVANLNPQLMDCKGNSVFHIQSFRTSG